MCSHLQSFFGEDGRIIVSGVVTVFLFEFTLSSVSFECFLILSVLNSVQIKKSDSKSKVKILQCAQTKGWKCKHTRLVFETCLKKHSFEGKINIDL